MCILFTSMLNVNILIYFSFVKRKTTTQQTVYIFVSEIMYLLHVYTEQCNFACGIRYLWRNVVN